MLKLAGPKIDTHGKNGQAYKRAKPVKLVNGKNGKPVGAENDKMLKPTGPKFDANGKTVKPVSALKWKPGRNAKA